MELSIIATIHTDFPEKFGLPRQSGLIPSLSGTIVFEKEYRNSDALRGIEGYSHLWLLWGFSIGFASADSENKRQFSPTVRPPRLGGNTRVGVFATRSPNRPNPIGLSCVKLEGIEDTSEFGTVLRVSGIDMADGTPIYDIKPYLPYVDSVPDAKGGFAADVVGDILNVSADESLLQILPVEKQEALREILASDPRPHYRADDGREYGFTFAGYSVTFTVSDGTATLTGISPETAEK